MEPTDPNFLVQKPKKERTPAQKLATQTAFTKLKEKRDSIREEREETVVMKKPTVKLVPKVVEPIIVVEEKSKPIVENKMNDEMINSIVSRLKTEMAPQPVVKEKKKKVVVVEEDSSSSEEEIVIRRKKSPKAEPSPPTVKTVQPEKEAPAVKRSTGSRVLDNLFYSK